MFSKILSILLLLTVTLAEIARYDNYRAYELIPKTSEQLKSIHELQESSDSLIFLQISNHIEQRSLVIVAPHKLADFVAVLDNDEITYRIVDENIQNQITKQFKSLKQKSTSTVDWTHYNTLEEINSWLDDLVKKYPNKVESVVGGKTYEGREIRGVKISFKKGNPGVFIEGGIHAREWIAPATVTYIANELLTNTDEKVRSFVENYDYYIFPVANPDGYKYTFEKDRFWRKTRKPYGKCFGADPNRNWDFHWHEAGTSSSACSDTYGGEKGFSEIETATLSEYILSLKGKIHTYIAFHSFSQLILFPYGHSATHAPNHNDLQAIGDAAAKRLAEKYGTRYTVGNVYDAIYPASGASMDWAYGVAEIPLSFTYELRPNGGFDGFELPEKEIIPTGEETFASVLTLLEEGKKLGYHDNNKNCFNLNKNNIFGKLFKIKNC
uniref:Putative carboxypeptidase n=1 Tax=Corethrella appendiculata TaxID=1370023 RepID=U5EXV3_9DIPT